MSLIEEALRRAQQAPSKAEPVVTTPESISEPTSLTRSSDPLQQSWSRAPQPRLVNATWWIGLAVGGAALIMLMLWGYSLLLRWQLAKNSVPDATPSRVVHVTSRPEPLQPTASRPPSGAKPALSPSAGATATVAKRKRPDLTLNGIVEGRGEPVAIINGLILRIGDSIAGATLLEIWGEEARLRWRDEDLILSTTR
ncbi:MAG TPA: hypothetical protein DDX89_02375 [Candidatus Omnitrophica bacterium]|nr:MAG: hypothetical protein A2Z92_00335 [Omnitrophica WOR_2 bacterium GWA2_63_20]OGX16874.1 MAG: hypothetical protein A2105_07050 [Omnitrophica WOR_2 bacterium GWF2_63_9]OGX36098.1 MAG: hypothetical protein A3B73_04350 [Omnitrophica WOR_2 bacterium RIFCSPHIGHO2_02_FULL_63_39]OGX44089.1 MAG: hypothetical protein A3I71_05445 [Omnitrophica WOR_2 bacterium RIFCSPLOWO2_02_FULL_63_16]OGX48996.1 MAG: hypothetical protein A3G88_04910 [Omnitrophica WOR_2 bacterium RIFCSPLOWO2_12_FULL_63_16]HAM41020.1 